MRHNKFNAFRNLFGRKNQRQKIHGIVVNLTCNNILNYKFILYSNNSLFDVVDGTIKLVVSMIIYCVNAV